MSNYQLLSTSRTGHAHNNYMQPEIMLDIFEKLPIEAILTCKCVCKTWLQLIEDPYFIGRQRRFALKQPPRALIHPNYVIPERRTSPLDKNHLYLVDFVTHKARPLRVPPALHTLSKELQVTSTCNGLLCIAAEFRESPVYVYNPILNYLVKLPSNGMKRKLISHQVGIMYHESSGSYRVVRGYHYSVRGQEHYTYKFEMITLGGTAWAELTPPSLLKECNLGRALEWRGAIHWKIQSAMVTRSPQCIMSFDIDSKAFQIVNFRDDPPLDLGLPMLVLDDELVIVGCEKSSLKIWKVGGDATGEFSIDQCSVMETNAQWDGYSWGKWIAETGSHGTYLLHTSYDTSNLEPISNMVDFSPATGSLTQLNLLGMPEDFTTFSLKPTMVSPLLACINGVRKVNGNL